MPKRAAAPFLPHDPITRVKRSNNMVPLHLGEAADGEIRSPFYLEWLPFNVAARYEFLVHMKMKIRRSTCSQKFPGRFDVPLRY